MGSSKEWTPARKHSFIVSILRSGSRRWPPRFETLNDAKTEKKINKKTGRLAQHYRCAFCSGEFPSKQVAADHRKAVVDPVDGFISWDIYIERLFCDKENYQILCTECHKVKSLKEKGERHTCKSDITTRKRNS